ncbi:PREDICTED: uncharacterized protein LOC108354211 [Rhagoletis zephyria]|uniref:uncharacterized protein LOC108354211 n=1 Tax=Rhagoletis zephyria TaxID=28612 RepID=UPI0008113144|nr:PREDICTED: uncharacterized protein LOC108354211 [Rhagoletis zephyria]
MDPLPNIQKPNAQAYYRRFSLEMKVEVEWKLAQAKVRNMRGSYNKAKGWEGSTGAGSMDGETIRSRLDIFGNRLVEAAVIEDSLDSVCEDIFNSTELVFEETTMSPTNVIVETENTASTSRKGIYSRTALTDIMEMQADMLNVRKQKADQDFRLREEELSLKKMNYLALKEREMELREKEMKSNERLKIMELEMKERLAMEELNRKYK